MNLKSSAKLYPLRLRRLVSHRMRCGRWCAICRIGRIRLLNRLPSANRLLVLRIRRLGKQISRQLSFVGIPFNRKKSRGTSGRTMGNWPKVHINVVACRTSRRPLPLLITPFSFPVARAIPVSTLIGRRSRSLKPLASRRKPLVSRKNRKRYALRRMFHRACGRTKVASLRLRN